MANAKSQYFTNVMSTNSENPHQFWSCINSIFHRQAAPSLPKHKSLSSLCYVFSGYFNDTIILVYSSFPVHMLNNVNVQLPQINSLLSPFTPATIEGPRQIMTNSPNKYNIDPLLNVLLKAYIYLLLGTVTIIITVSCITNDRCFSK